MRFVGWYSYDIAPGSGAIRLDDFTRAPNHHVTVYARWESNTSPTRHLDYWWPDNSEPIPIRRFEIPSNLGSYWSFAMSYGVRNWNDSTAPVDFIVTGTAVNRVQAGTIRAGFFGILGMNTAHIPFDTFDSFDIMLCEVGISNHARDNHISLLAVIESVMAHELGHAVGLGDGEQDNEFANRPWTLGGFSNASLMNAERDRNIVRGPQAFDITSVRMIYDERR